ncbi:MAG: replicative DNA helicase, partial [Chloracidobacterium sp.]
LGESIDPTTLYNYLKSIDKTFDTGGVSAISALMDGFASPASLNTYIRIVKNLSNLRRLIRACHGAVEACYYPHPDASNIIGVLESELLAITQSDFKHDFQPIASYIPEVLEKIEQVHSGKKDQNLVQTGFNDFDRLTNGLRPGDLIIVAARPSAGKTAFCLNLAYNAATLENKKIAFFSLEMSGESLTMRLICSAGNIDSHRLQSGLLRQQELDSLMEHIETLKACNIFIDDTSSININEMRAKAKRLKYQKGNIDLIIIDYIQLIKGHGKYENRQTEVSAISRELKHLARDLNTPVIAISQLSRAPETRSNHRPMLSDLRESGSLEQDADVVVFIFREEMYEPSEQNFGQAEIIVAKQRNGPTGTVNLMFVKETVRFDNPWDEPSF